ncbi:MAG: DUF1573 domain-containing protein [Thermoguttaceae bacterium]
MSLLRLIYLIFLFLLLIPNTQAQDWVSQLFPVKEHNFGDVPKDAKVTYRFQVYNPFEEEIQISSVNSSCTCSSPTVETPVVQTYQTGSILVRFNTDRLTGPQKATLTVSITKPYPQTATLQVRGNIRKDVSFRPGSVNFEDVPLGTEKTKTVKVVYRGSSSLWNVKSVDSSNPDITVEVLERSLLKEGIEVPLQVTLSANRPVGPVNEQLLITSNDLNSRIPLLVEGHVRGEYSVKPETLYLGTILPEQTITRAIVISGLKPFRLLGLDSSDKTVVVDPESIQQENDDPKMRFVLPLKLRANAVSEPTSVSETVTFQTDDPENPLKLTIYGVVKP